MAFICKLQQKNGVYINIVGITTVLYLYKSNNINILWGNEENQWIITYRYTKWWSVMNSRHVSLVREITEPRVDPILVHSTSTLSPHHKETYMPLSLLLFVNYTWITRCVLRNKYSTQDKNKKTFKIKSGVFINIFIIIYHLNIKNNHSFLNLNEGRYYFIISSNASPLYY